MSPLPPAHVSKPGRVERPPYVVVAGNIGAGKSSFVEYVARNYPFEPIEEPNEANPFLEPFYGDMKRWSFASQMFFLSAKIGLHQEIEERAQAIIQDRSIWEDAEIFARHLANARKMSGDEFALYRAYYDRAEAALEPPSLVIYLRCPPRVLRRRIRKRGRDMEQDLPRGYLLSLHRLYESWFASYDRSPKVVIPTDRVDPVTDLVDSATIHDLLSPLLD